MGGDFLKKTEINLKYDTLEVEWYENTIPMETFNKPAQVTAHVDECLTQMEMEEMEFEIDSYLTTPILDAKYNKLDVEEVFTEHSSHLTLEQQNDFRELLRKHKELFNGMLGKYPGDPMHIELEPNAAPVYKRPHPIPHVHLVTFKKELDHLVKL